MSTWAYQPKHEYWMSIPAQTWVHEHTSPKHEYMSILAQTWVQEHTRSKDSTWSISPLWRMSTQRYEHQTWVHEHTSPNMSTWDCRITVRTLAYCMNTGDSWKYVHDITQNTIILYYMSIPALVQTWVPEHTSPNMSTWAYCMPKHEYLSIPIIIITWLLHEHTSPNMSTWAY